MGKANGVQTIQEQISGKGIASGVPLVIKGLTNGAISDIMKIRNNGIAEKGREVSHYET